MSQDLIVSWIRVIMTIIGAIAGITGIIILAQNVAKSVVLKVNKMTHTEIAIYVCLAMVLGVFVGFCTDIAVNNINYIGEHKTIVKEEKKQVINNDGRQMYGVRQAEAKRGIK